MNPTMKAYDERRRREHVRTMAVRIGIGAVFLLAWVLFV
jgi:hypothetical protein